MMVRTPLAVAQLGAAVSRGLRKLNLARAAVGSDDFAASYSTEIDTPDGRRWSLRLTPLTQGEAP